MYTNRVYENEADLERMIALLVAIRAPDRISDHPSIVDIHELTADAQVRVNTRLWFDADDQLVAFCIVDRFHNLLFELLSNLYASPIISQIIDWGITCLARSSANRLYSNSRGDDKKRLEFLKKHDFREEPWRTLRLSRLLNEPIATPELPLGFQIRGVKGTHEVEALVQLHHAAFGTDNMAIESRLAMMSVPDYVPDLDLVAVAPDGQLAAFCMCSINYQENAYSGQLVGYTDPVGTHPDFQRLGLGRALLQTGCHLLKQQGMKIAILGTSSANLPMQQLAQTVGYRIESEKLRFAKNVAIP